MYESNVLELWNLTANGSTVVNSQEILNVVGRLKSPENVQKIFYSLNGGAEVPIFFNREQRPAGRLSRFGDFNIDAIRLKELRQENHLRLRVVSRQSGETTDEVFFRKKSMNGISPEFRLNLNGYRHPEQAGQVIDGKWQMSHHENFGPCLEIKKEDTGLDRIILFGNHKWTTGYEILARLMVVAWTGYPHNVGIVFKWNPHLQGDGSILPSQWSTGLAYYYSHCPGLRLRFGVNVYVDDKGIKHGDYVMNEKTLSFYRRWIGRNVNRILRTEAVYSQVAPLSHYWFRVLVHPKKYALTVWKVGKKEPKAQLSVSNPIERLKSGSVGIIAHRCAVRLYEFNVTSVD